MAFHRSIVKGRSIDVLERGHTAALETKNENPASLPDHSHVIQDSTNGPTDQIPKELCHRGSFPLTQELEETSKLCNRDER
jgi:hypothetical protein